MATFSHDGVDLYFEESGVGDPVLLLPGWGGSVDELRPLRDSVGRRYRAIAVDVPGSGKSGPQPRAYTPSYYHDDVPVFDALLKSIGASPAHIVGFSDGGEYGLLLAALFPKSVRSLVTWGAAGSLGTNLQLAEMMATVIDDPILPMQGFSMYLKSTYGEENARLMTKTAASAFRTIIAAGGDISRSLAGRIRCPALLVTGEHDFLASPALVSDMAGAIPRGEFIEARGASHPIHLEQPDWLVGTVDQWLSGASASDSGSAALTPAAKSA